jgi:hypothetical protein
MSRTKTCCKSQSRQRTPPTPRPQASLPHPPLVWEGPRGKLAGEKVGGRVPMPTRGHTLWYSVYTYMYFVLSILFAGAGFFVKLNFFIPFSSVPSLVIDSSVNLGMPRNEHFLPRNNGSHSESIPRNFFGTKFRANHKSYKRHDLR